MKISAQNEKAIRSLLEMVRSGDLEQLASQRSKALASLALEGLSGVEIPSPMGSRVVAPLITDDERDALMDIFMPAPAAAKSAARLGM